MSFKIKIIKDEELNDFAIHLDIEGARAWMKYLDLKSDEDTVKGFQVEQIVLREMKKYLE